MRYAACRADLVAEALQRKSVDHRFRQELERHLLAEFEIVRSIYLAHAAASQQRNNAVTLGNQVSGSKAFFIAGFIRFG
jgi:hypothetical protein